MGPHPAYAGRMDGVLPVRLRRIRRGDIDTRMKLPPLTLLAILLLGLSTPLQAAVVFNVAVAESGFYRVDFRDLGDDIEPAPSATLRLYERGVPVDIEVDDSGDGIFGRGDRIFFVGRHLEAANSWYDEHSRYNVYQLHLGANATAPIGKREPANAGTPIIRHLEQDLVRVALPHAAQPSTAQAWYWQRITHLADDAFRHELALTSSTRRIRVALSGLSRDRNASAAGMPHHQVQLRLDGEVIAEHAWDGQESVILEIPVLPVTPINEGGSLLEVSVPARNVARSGLPLIDAVLLNWIEVEFSPNAMLGASTIADRQGRFRLLVDEDRQPPAWVKKAKTSADLTGAGRQADYLMISHPSLLEALEPLAAWHRARGLSVAVIDVEAVYDQFNNGIQSPLAIRRFISQAWHTWQRPAPRLVLLAGDASWERAPGAGGDRNLVPTMQIRSHGGFAASDNGLVTVSGDDWRPDLAIGRLPAGTPEELSAMVTKLLRHANASPGGEWRRRSTWIADANADFQRISNELSGSLQGQGLSRRRIYPRESAEGSLDEQARILAAFNEGSALVHFLGHGGRFVWRTSAPDLRGATDLFGLDDIRALQASDTLPLVLSMTCSSGPFDHPFADSLAEAFLLAPNRGAMGVIAASWRVPPSKRFSELLVTALFKNGTRIGEALMQAKQKESRRLLVESYNLLGDPALQLRAAVATP